MPLPRSLKTWPLCVPGRHLEIRFAFECRHRNFAAERRHGEGDRHFAIEIVFFALEDRMLLDVNDDIKIAGRSAADSGFAIA